MHSILQIIVCSIVHSIICRFSVVQIIIYIIVCSIVRSIVCSIMYGFYCVDFYYGHSIIGILLYLVALLPVRCLFCTNYCADYYALYCANHGLLCKLSCTLSCKSLYTLSYALSYTLLCDRHALYYIRVLLLTSRHLKCL